MASATERTITVSRGEDCWRGEFNAMASPCEVLFRSASREDAQALTDLVAREVWRIEDKFSRYRDDNVVAGINQAGGKAISVDAETAQLLDFSATLHELSGGKFDITSGVLRRIWQFDGGHESPQQKVVDEILGLVGWEKVEWNDGRIQLQPAMQIDFGGIGKEYAVDRAAALLRDAFDASCLVNLGGDLAVSQRAPDTLPWQVGVEDVHKEIPATVIKLAVGALATSGDSRRFVMVNGNRMSHILDAHTGWPVLEAPRSVTVAADTCTQAGMLSTLASLQGKDAEAFLQEQGVEYWCTR